MCSLRHSRASGAVAKAIVPAALSPIATSSAALGELIAISSVVIAGPTM